MMSDILRLMNVALDLKRTPREGWRRCGIDPCESVGDHSFATALLAMLIAREEGADVGLAVQIAVLHDLAEAETGDVVTESEHGVDHAALKVKTEVEQATLKKIFKGDAALLKLAKAYHDQDTLEANIARDASRLEMAIQALRYEQEGATNLGSFFQSAKWPLKTTTAKKIMEELEKRRDS